MPVVIGRRGGRVEPMIGRWSSVRPRPAARPPPSSPASRQSRRLTGRREATAMEDEVQVQTYGGFRSDGGFADSGAATRRSRLPRPIAIAAGPSGAALTSIIALGVCLHIVSIRVWRGVFQRAARIKSFRRFWPSLSQCLPRTRHVAIVGALCFPQSPDAPAGVPTSRASSMVRLKVASSSSSTRNARSTRRTGSSSTPPMADERKRCAKSQSEGQPISFCPIHAA